MAEKQKELKTSATKQGEVLTAQFEYSARKHFHRRLGYENPYQRDVHDWGKYDTVYRVWYCLSVCVSVCKFVWCISQISTYHQVNAAQSEATCDSVGQRFIDSDNVVQKSGR